MTKLKSAIIILAIVAMASVSSAQQIYTTKKGYIAAVTKSRLERAIKYIGQDDNAAFGIMLRSGQVAPLTRGIKVFVEDTSWGLIKIRPVGVIGTVWTVIDAVE